MLLNQRSRKRKSEIRKERKQEEEEQKAISGETRQKREASAKNISGFKVMKMAVQHFHVFKVSFGNLRSKFAKFWGKNAYFCRKEAKVAQRSPPSMEGGDL